MHAELGGTSKTLNCPTIIVGGVEDHIHLLARESRTIALSEWVKELKRVTSIWIKEKSPQFDTFAWQAGYGAFSVGQTQLEQVKAYIARQKQHHAKRNFEDELRFFFKKYGVEFDERYVWG